MTFKRGIIGLGLKEVIRKEFRGAFEEAVRNG